MNWKPSDMYKEPMESLAESVDDFIIRKLNMEAMNVEFTISNEEQRKIVKTGKSFIDLLLCKNNDYGSSVFKKPVLAPNMAVDAAIRVRMSDKIERLQNLLKNNPQLVAESVEDTVKDLGAYCLLWLVAKEIDNEASQQ